MSCSASSVLPWDVMDRRHGNRMITTRFASFCIEWWLNSTKLRSPQSSKDATNEKDPGLATVS